MIFANFFILRDVYALDIFLVLFLFVICEDLHTKQCVQKGLWLRICRKFQADIIQICLFRDILPLLRKQKLYTWKKKKKLVLSFIRLWKMVK